jgi:hypothetical protein
MSRQPDLRTPQSPNLPLATDAYNRGQQEQLLRALRLYFNTLDNTWQALLSPEIDRGLGGGYLHFPYGSFYDTTDQTAADTTTAYVIGLNSTTYSNGVTIDAGTKVMVAFRGAYNIQFSIQLKNTTNSSQDVDIWFRKNGTDIPDSNSRFGIPARASSGDPSHTIAALNFIVELTVNDYVELVWRTSDVGVVIEQYPVDTSPDRPATPSIILTTTFVSRID